MFSIKAPGSTSCSTPAEYGQQSCPVRPFAFNTLSPLHSKAVSLIVIIHQAKVISIIILLKFKYKG